MTPLLLDENLGRALQKALREYDPGLVVLRVGDPEAPPQGTKDPELLKWLEAKGFILVSDNRKTLQGHLNDHLSQGGHVGGILWLRPKAAYRKTIEDLALIARADAHDEFGDCIRFVPL
jgi:hypothetical protein